VEQGRLAQCRTNRRNAGKVASEMDPITYRSLLRTLASVATHVEVTLEKSMKLSAFVASLVIATASIMTSSSYAQSVPPVQNSAPGVSVPGPAPRTPPTAPIGTIDRTVPPADGRQETLEDCTSFWDPGTHMSKSEWREACQRTLNGQVF
jgi:hypothetical protein